MISTYTLKIFTQIIKQMTNIEQQIREFTNKEVPIEVQDKRAVMSAELHNLFFMDEYAVADHLRQCNEHLDALIKEVKNGK